LIVPVVPESPLVYTHPRRFSPELTAAQELIKQREEEENVLAASAAELDERIAALRARIAAMLEATAQARKTAAEQTDDNAKLEEAQGVRRQVVDLLPNADENIAKLQGIIDASAKRLLALGAKWAEHRRGMIGELRQLKVRAGAAVCVA
jgi:coiled-coil domain-containing protein 22